MRNTHKHKGWNQIEDKAIGELVHKHGTKQWARIAREMASHYGLKGKTGKQCRERWYNHLNPGISKSEWTQEEENIMFKAHKQFGNKWKSIAERLPGRTDNSIKNHFYSTIRRSLRRIGKLTGSKNSTFQMRKIKPITLSKIFCLAEGREFEDEEEYGLNIEKINIQKKQKILNQLKENCQKIANVLMLFAQQKPNSNLKNLPVEQVNLYKHVLEKMVQINELYEGQKNSINKIRKQRKLQKNFDEASISSEEDPPEPECFLGEQEPLSESFVKKQQKITSRGRESRIKLPTFDPSEGYNFSKTPVKDRNEEQVKIQDYNEDLNLFNTKKQDQKLSENKNQEDYQFSIDFEQGEDLNLFGLELSPGILHTPMALTPTGFQPFSKETSQNIQPFKNEQCNDFVEKLREQVQKNSKNQQKRKEVYNYMNLYPSPSSAFRPCF